MIGGTGARPVGPTFRNFRLANGWQLSTLFAVWLIRSVPATLAMGQESATDPSQRRMVVPIETHRRTQVFEAPKKCLQS
jgi:hypothetical protein